MRGSGAANSKDRCSRREPFEDAAFGGPGLDQRLGRDSPRCVSQRQRNDDDVVERADHGEELRDEVNR